MAQPSTPRRPLELLLLSPGGGLISPTKRRITPSGEDSSPKRIAVVRPGSVPALQASVRTSANLLPNPLRQYLNLEQALQGTLLPSFHIRPQDLITNGSIPDIRRPAVIPNPLFQPHLAIFPRHITFPFDFRDAGAPHPLDDEAKELIFDLFPGTSGIAYDGSFLYLTVDPLPPKPWPKTIGGLPALFFASPRPGAADKPVQGRFVPSRNGRLAEDKNYRDVEDWSPLFVIVRDHFADLGIPMTEVMYWGNFIIIVLEKRDTDLTKIPASVAKVNCQVVFEDEMGRPKKPQARRQHDPSPGNPDETKYETLRPGVRVSSGYLPDEPGAFITSTAGVLVKNSLGDKYLTVAGHGFPAECGLSVMHPSPSNGRDIGEPIIGIGHTDIAVVKLRDSEQFVNTTFHNTLLEESVQLRRLAKRGEYRSGDTTYIDSPDTGCIEGLLQLQSFTRFPSDDPTAQEWAFTTWYYMGQESAELLPSGMCGSTIWTKDGDVIGLFQYAPKDGLMRNWCAGVGAEELIKRGFTLA